METEAIDLDVKTQEMIKIFVKEAKQNIAQINAQVQERMGLIVNAYVNAKGVEGDYQVSKDFTKLVVSE